MNIPPGIMHQPKNTLPQITDLWAYVSVGPDDGNEGVCAVPMGNAVVPLIGADRERVRSLLPYAREVARATGRRVRLVRLSHRTVEVDDVLAAT